MCSKSGHSRVIMRLFATHRRTSPAPSTYQTMASTGSAATTVNQEPHTASATPPARRASVELARYTNGSPKSPSHITTLFCPTFEFALNAARKGLNDSTFSLIPGSHKNIF